MWLLFKVNVVNDGTNYYVPSDMTCIHFVAFLPKVHILNLIVNDRQTQFQAHFKHKEKTIPD